MESLAPLHGTAVAVAGIGVLLIGPSGSGKSDLAMRLIDRGALLVADDYVQVLPKAGRLQLSAPPAIAGLMEVRGIGLLRQPILAEVEAGLVVDLATPPDRLPEDQQVSIGGIDLPLIRLRAFEASAPTKIEWALAHLAGPG